MAMARVLSPCTVRKKVGLSIKEAEVAEGLTMETPSGLRISAASLVLAVLSVIQAKMLSEEKRDMPPCTILHRGEFTYRWKLAVGGLHPVSCYENFKFTKRWVPNCEMKRATLNAIPKRSEMRNTTLNN